MKSTYVLMLLSVLILYSCSKNSMFEDHPLVGNYLGSWESTSLDFKIAIEASEDEDGLVMLFSLADSFRINVMSGEKFDVDRFERNGFSNYLKGALQGDTLFMDNETYPISDTTMTPTIRKGTFVKQF